MQAELFDEDAEPLDADEILKLKPHGEVRSLSEEINKVDLEAIKKIPLEDI